MTVEMEVDVRGKEGTGIICTTEGHHNYAVKYREESQRLRDWRFLENSVKCRRDRCKDATKDRESPKNPENW
jgi:hypothetical protein